MSNDEDLDPRIGASLRAITPATDEERDAHITHALSFLSSTSATKRGSQRMSSRWLATAAAFLLLIGGGFVLRSNNANNEPAVAIASDTTNIVKNSTVQNGQCGKTGATYVGSYNFNNEDREIWTSTSGITVSGADSCATLIAITHIAAPANTTVCVPSLQNKTDEIIGDYVAEGAYRVLVRTTTHLEIYGSQDCLLLARYPQP